MINFDQLSTSNTIDTILEPRDLFNVLPNKNTKYQYPRDVQSQVWKSWFKLRDADNTIIKMNTGSGKTVVGLLILKSCLNENKGPAVYVVPDNCLVEQVMHEADELGIAYTSDPASNDFRRGRAILIINIYKLVNGQSVFGVGESIRINIGSLIIDDAHACIDSVESQFTINIDREDPAYKGILEIFLPALKNQSNSKAIEIEEGMPGVIAQVPFWTWQENIISITRILAKKSKEESLLFKWNLLKEHLKLCRCVIGSDCIEVTPHCIPIERIPSLVNAKRKIFMTATLVDDSILSSHFNVEEDSIRNPIFPDSASDIGDRMIIVPQELNPEIADEEIKVACKKLSSRMNVVVIVPSYSRSEFWEDVADNILYPENIQDEIKQMKTAHKGLVVLVNRYDGIDLPKDACRLLVIDGLPDVRRKIDKINENLLQNSDSVIANKIQKIEQGMGRGVRSNEDYCVVFLMGSTLVNHLYSNNAIEKFSSGTKAQFKLSDKLAEQLKGKCLDEIIDVCNYCLERNKQWVASSKGALATLKYDVSHVDQYIISLRKAFEQCSIGNYGAASTIINNEANNIASTPVFKGYVMQTLAEFTNFTDKVEAQNILQSGLNHNRYILKPIEGISYKRINSTTRQAEMVQTFITDRFDSHNSLLIETNEIIEQLIFKPDTANRFEEAFKNLAPFLGYTSQRPEKEYGRRGPDVLWAVGELKYFIIECKNGVTNTLISKRDINQLTGSVEWFKAAYDTSCTCSPLIIHLGNECEYSATPTDDSLVLMKDSLDEIITNLQGFFKVIYGKISSVTDIQKLLIAYKLTPDAILSFCKPISIKR